MPFTLPAQALFDGWSGVWRVLVIAPAAYAALVLILRASGKRTLSKLNAFDFVITIGHGAGQPFVCPKAHSKYWISRLKGFRKSQPVHAGRTRWR